MKIVNANVFLNGSFVKGGIEFESLITNIGSSVNGEGDLDAGGAFIIPGLIDIHTHAAVGEDSSDGRAEGLLKLSKYYAGKGVTSWCPTTMTLSIEALTNAMNTVSLFKRPENGAKIAGVNLEGPFINISKKGAQNPDFIRKPDIEILRKLNCESGGMVKMITVAPEVEGAIDFIRQAGKDFTVSLGHTDADYETAMEAFDAGARHVTHLFNAMPSLHHRLPGVIAAAADSGASAELITDGFHVHPAMVRIAERIFSDRLVLISDSIRCAGMEDGEYDLGGLDVTMKNGKALLSGTDTLAGSSIHLMDGVLRSMEFGIPFEKAVEAATIRAARVIGEDDKIGSLEKGKAADFVILSGDYKIIDVYIDGKSIGCQAE